MLLIGDIHINTPHKDKILTAIRVFVAKQPEEKHLIFLGDIVYHFSYDRGALLAFYDLCLEFYQQGKQLYILAGNHDRLGNSFVFEEAKKAFQLLQVFIPWSEREAASGGKIYFITTPLLTEIEGKPICFLPYMLDINLADYPGIEQFQDTFYHEQLETGNKHQILSAKLHLLIQYFRQRQPHLTFIHHYYFDGIAFPGQVSKFSFRNVALSSQWLEEKEISFISGHLHQAFSYKNYLCTGSIRATSPLEENSIKGFFSFIDGKFSFYESGVNYYFTLEYEKQPSSLFETAFSPLSAFDISTHYHHLQDQTKLLLSGLNGEYHFLPRLDFKSVTVSLRVDELNYQRMDDFVSPELQIQLQDVKLKKQQAKVDDLLEQLQQTDFSSLKQGFSGWIDLLQRFLRKQYPDTYLEYEKILQELKLMV